MSSRERFGTEPGDPVWVCLLYSPVTVSVCVDTVTEKSWLDKSLSETWVGTNSAVNKAFCTQQTDRLGTRGSFYASCFSPSLTAVQLFRASLTNHLSPAPSSGLHLRMD